MAGRGMGCATRGGGAVESGPRNKMISKTSDKTGPVMMKNGGAHRVRYSHGESFPELDVCRMGQPRAKSLDD
jgi:hypothetical protein